MLDLKVGDNVIEESSTTGRIYNVVRLTKTLAVLSGGRRMSLNKGYEFGGSASWPRSFRLATPAEVMTWDERQVLQSAGWVESFKRPFTLKTSKEENSVRIE